MSHPLFGAPIPPEQDPAQLLDELRNLRPLMEQVERLRELVLAMQGFDVAGVQQFRAAMREYTSVMARLDAAYARLDEIEGLLALLDQMDVLVRRQ